MKPKKTHAKPENVEVHVTANGWAIRLNDPNLETRFRPLSHEEVESALTNHKR